MTKLYAMRGLPGSGKTTLAAKIAKRNDAVIVNRDQLRRMLLGSWWTGDKSDENRVTVAEGAQVTALLKAGISTVVDATHLEPRYLRRWARLATRLGVEFEVIDVVADVDKCQRRAYERWRTPGYEFGRYIDPDIIEARAKKYPVEKWPVVTAEPFHPEPVEFVEGLPEAIIVDIDGTLAHIPDGGRSPYSYDNVGEDVVDEQIRWLVNELAGDLALKIIVMSGRDDTCREDTEKWLIDNRISFDELHMRPADAKDEHGSKLPDFRVKYDLFNRYIRGNYNVRFVLDDRSQVVTHCWRAMGLKCLQVEPGDF